MKKLVVSMACCLGLALAALVCTQTAPEAQASTDVFEIYEVHASGPDTLELTISPWDGSGPLEFDEGELPASGDHAGWRGEGSYQGDKYVNGTVTEHGDESLFRMEIDVPG